MSWNGTACVQAEIIYPPVKSYTLTTQSASCDSSTTLNL